MEVVISASIGNTRSISQASTYAWGYYTIRLISPWYVSDVDMYHDMTLMSWQRTYRVTIT